MKSNEVFVPRSRHSWSSFQSVIVHTMKSEPYRGSISPLKVVKQRPQKVPSYVCSFPVHATNNFLTNNTEKKSASFKVPYCCCQGIQVSTQVFHSFHVIDHFFSGEVEVLFHPNSYMQDNVYNSKSLFPKLVLLSYSPCICTHHFQ